MANYFRVCRKNDEVNLINRSDYIHFLRVLLERSGSSTFPLIRQQILFNNFKKCTITNLVFKNNR